MLSINTDLLSQCPVTLQESRIFHSTFSLWQVYADPLRKYCIVYYRLCFLTYTLTQLDFFSSQQDKVQRETEKIIHFSEPVYNPTGFS